MAMPTDFWEELTPEDNYGQALPPPTPEAELRRWEAEHGVAMPATLAGAFLVQAGGIVRGTGNGLVLQSVDFFQPLTAGRWTGVYEAGDGLLADRAKMFVVGDHQGCGVVLDYNVGPEPRVLALWYDMGDELRDDDDGTFDQFIQKTRDMQAEADEEDLDDEDEE